MIETIGPDFFCVVLGAFATAPAALECSFTHAGGLLKAPLDFENCPPVFVHSSPFFFCLRQSPPMPYGGLGEY